MIDMGVNKVVFGAVAIMDISDSTVTEDTLGKGITAYRADGEKIVGTADLVPPPKNMLASAIDTSGNIYNSKGWKDSTRLSSSGGDSSANGMSTTGYIPCKKGDVITLKGINHKPAGSTNYRLIFYTSSFALNSDALIQGGYSSAYTEIGAVTDSSGNLTRFAVANYSKSNGTTVDVSNVAYFRICGDTFASDASITVSSTNSGSGGGSDGVTMCTVEIMATGPAQQTKLYYLNENLEMVEQTVSPMDSMMGYTIRCPINSFIRSDYSYFSDASGSSSPTLQPYTSLYLIVKGDGRFVIS